MNTLILINYRTLILEEISIAFISLVLILVLILIVSIVVFLYDRFKSEFEKHKEKKNEKKEKKSKTITNIYYNGYGHCTPRIKEYLPLVEPDQQKEMDKANKMFPNDLYKRNQWLLNQSDKRLNRKHFIEDNFDARHIAIIFSIVISILIAIISML
jgi:hypothetical protein